MKALFLGVALALAATTVQAATCNGLYNDMVEQTNYINNNAGSWGICRLAKESAELYWVAYQYHQDCVDGGGGQANEYYRAYEDAQNTANASCG